MKVLNHGKYYGNKIEESCYQCECDFEYGFEDIKEFDKPRKEYNGFLGYIREFYHYVNCPDCGKEIYVSEIDYNMLEIFDEEVKENGNS